MLNQKLILGCFLGFFGTQLTQHGFTDLFNACATTMAETAQSEIAIFKLIKHN